MSTFDEDARFDLTANPFHLLGVSPSSRKDEIAAAARQDTRHSAPALEDALHALLAPDLRLQAELSWFLYAVPHEIAALMQKLAAGQYADCVPRFRAMVDIDGANVAAHLCGTPAGSLETAELVVEAYVALDTYIGLRILRQRRAASGFPAPDLAMLGPALAAVRRAHARAVVGWLATQPDPLRQMLTVIETVISEEEDWYEAEVYSHLTMIAAEIAIGCDRWMSPALLEIRDKIAATMRAQGPDLDLGIVADCDSDVTPPLEPLRAELMAALTRQGADPAAARRSLARIAKLIEALARLVDR